MFPLTDTIEPSAEIALELSSVASEEVAGRGLANAGASVDLDALGWKGAQLEGATQLIFKDPQTETFENYQGYSNIAADTTIGVAEVFLTQEIGEHFAFRSGRLDGAGSFGTTALGASFLNPSMGFAPTLGALPTFPAPNWGTEATFSPVPALTGSIAIYHTDTGPYTISQLEGHWMDGKGHAATGAWHNGDQNGIFGVIDQQILGSAEDRGLGVFLQVDTAGGTHSALSTHAGGGLVVSGPLAIRAKDALGVGATWVMLEDGQQELVSEGWYTATMNDHIALQADIQGITSPEQQNVVAMMRMNFAL